LEMALADGSNNLLFALSATGIGWEGGTKIFDNSTRANYQGILYSNNSGTNAATTYSFYLELR
ncbi:hypothetical protein HY994_00910, partial [Candidatus Micrarchaeota archaeon]|nr:hypothetical protein [Candidatus Micrarchaeota archaeon]